MKGYANIRLAAYDKMRDKLRELSCENQKLRSAMEGSARDGNARLIKETVTVTRNPFSTLSQCEKKIEFFGFDDLNEEYKKEYFERLANQLQSADMREIGRLKEENAKLRHIIAEQQNSRPWWKRMFETIKRCLRREH